MHRFVVKGDWQAGDVVAFPGEEAMHAFKVLRLTAGDEVELSNAQGCLFAAQLIEVTREAVSARVVSTLADTEAPVHVTLYQGFPKAEKLELIVQKMTELGVSRVVPVMMSRSVVKMDEKDGEKRRQRLERIAMEASKQSGRSRIPEICAPVQFKDALAMMGQHELTLMPWEDARGTRLHDLKERFPNVRDLALLIGPEGGISGREAEQACEAGGHILTLGPRILRAETAAIVSAAIVMALWGDV